MPTKKIEPEILETTEEVPEIAAPFGGITSESVLGVLGDRRRQFLVENFTASMLTGLKIDLDGKMPNQEQRKKIVNFAVKMADDVIAATD
jgi:hypothetical protein